MFKKKFLIFIGVLVVLGVAGRFYLNMQMAKFMSHGPGGPVPVLLHPAQASLLEVKIKSVGTILSNESASIRPEITGVVTSILFEEGQEVKAGDPLLEIDDSIYKAEMDAAKAAFDIAKITYNRRNQLQQQGAYSIQEKDEAKAKFEGARALLDAAKEKLEKTRINAPFDGIIGLRSVSKGDYLDMGQVITNLEDINPVKVEFTAPEKYISKISLGQNINLIVDAYSDKVFVGKVYAIDPKVDVDNRNIVIKAELDNSEKLLRPGMFANIELIIERKENAILIPEQAVFAKGNQMYVYKVENNKAVLTAVKVGSWENAKSEIIDGVKVGDVIVSEGHMKLHDGGEVVDANQMKK